MPLAVLWLDGEAPFVGLTAIPVALLGQDQEALVLQLVKRALGGRLADPQRLRRLAGKLYILLALRPISSAVILSAERQSSLSPSLIGWSGSDDVTAR